MKQRKKGAKRQKKKYIIIKIFKNQAEDIRI